MKYNVDYLNNKRLVEQHVPRDALVMVGVSGGKDSLVLLDLYANFRPNMVYINVRTPADGDNEENIKYLNYLEKKYDIYIHSVSEEDNMEEYIIQRELNCPEDPYKIWDTVLKCGAYIYRAGRRVIGHDDFYCLFGNTTDNTPVWRGNPSTLYRGKEKKVINPLHNISDAENMQYTEDNLLKLHPIYSRGFTKNTKIPCFLWFEDEETLDRNVELTKHHYPESFRFWVEWENTNGFPFFRKDGETVKWLRDYDTEDSNN